MSALGLHRAAVRFRKTAGVPMRPNEPVNRLMSEPVVAIELDAPASDILRLFAAHPFHHLPVVNEGKVVGMLSSADVLTLEAFLPKRAGVTPDYLDKRIGIDKLLRRPPVTIGATQPVEQAAKLMMAHGIHALPVTDAADRLLGIITTTDIIHAMLNETGGTYAPAAEIEPGIHDTPVSAANMLAAERLAERVSGSNDDLGTLAGALLQSRSRVKVLESVLPAADRYVHAGQDERLHTVLVKAVSQAKDQYGPAPALGL
jgi:CBS domain-containing protein